MSSNIGSLVISLEANMAKFNDDMNRASQVTQQAMSQVEAATARAAESIKFIGLSMAGLAAGVSFAALVNQFDQVIESAAGLKDMAEKTGASVENLSGLAAVAKIVGQDMGSVEAAMTKFAKNLAGTSDESKGTAHALDALGLKMRDLRQMDSAEGLKLVADRMAEYKDGVGKTALAQDLFGKSGAQLLPYLKDLAESGDLVAKTTAAQAAQADEYEKNIKRLTIAKNALYKTITMEALPAVNAFLAAMVDSKARTEGVQGAVRDLAKDGSLRSWAEQGAMYAAYVVDAFDGVMRVFRITGATIAAAAAQFNELRQGNFSGVSAVGEEWKKNVDTILMQQTFSSRVAQHLAENRSSLPDPGPANSLAGYQSNLGAAKKVKEEKDDYDRLMRSITEKIAA